MREIMANERARSKIRVHVPGRTPLVFSAINIEPTSGFRLVGDNEYEPNPDVPDSDLSYTWFGNSGSRQMTIAVHKGRMSATIQFDDRVYAISSRDGESVIRQFDPGQMLGDADEGISLANAAPTAVPGASQHHNLTLPTLAKNAVDTVDVLVVHTAAALAGVGNDQAQLNATIAEAFQQSESSFATSGVNTLKIRNVLAGSTNLSEFVDYDEDSGWVCGGGTNATQCRWIGHRVWLRTDATVQALRNSYGADIVVMLVGDSGLGGVAYTQRPDCGSLPNYESTLGCTVGAGYSEFAYAVVWVGQATVFQIFAHETGHQFGMEHTTTSGTPSYAWSFAKLIPSTAQTIMGTALFARSLQYSNPNVLFIGRTETSGETLRFNARTAYCLAPVMSGYRAPNQILRLFWNGFEDSLVPLEGC